MPGDCYSITLPPPTILNLRGETYILLRGLRFDDKYCRPNITSIAISGDGEFSIALLQMVEHLTDPSGNFFYEVARESLNAAHPGYPLKIIPFQLDVQNDVITIALAVSCRSSHRDCVFNATSWGSAQYATEIPSEVSYVKFTQDQYSLHPVLSLSLSCK